MSQGIQDAIRSSLAHIRQSRIAPSTINAPPPGFVPPALGVGLPQTTTGSGDSVESDSHAKTRGLQEERVESVPIRALHDLSVWTRLVGVREAPLRYTVGQRNIAY